MIVLGVVFIFCLVAFFVDVYASPGITFPGWVSAVAFGGMCLAGMTLAIQAL
jgi:hypothetical protein